MKKILFSVLLLTLMGMAVPLLAQTNQPPAGLFGPCAESTLKYFPQKKIEEIAGQSVNAAGFTQLICMFSPGTTPDSATNITVTVMSLPDSYQSIADKMYTDARANVKMVIRDGSGSCDRYFSKSRTNNDGEEIGYYLYGQKGSSMFGIASSKMPSVTAEGLEKALQYACSQDSITSTPVSQTTASTPVDRMDDPSKNSFPGFLNLYLALGVLVLIVISFLWYIIKHKKNSASSDNPTIPPQLNQ